MRKTEYLTFVIWGALVVLTALRGKASGIWLFVALTVSTIAAGLTIWRVIRDRRR